VAIVATKALRHLWRDRNASQAIAYPESASSCRPQNGVGNEEKLAAAFGADNVVAAALTTRSAGSRR